MQIKNSSVPAGCGSASPLPLLQTPKSTAKPSRDLDKPALSHTIKINKPTGFKIDAYPELIPYTEQVYYILDSIYAQLNQRKTEYVAMNNRVWRCIIKKPTILSFIIRRLILHGLLIRSNNKPIQGVRSWEYKLGAMLKGPWERYELTNRYLKTNILLNRFTIKTKSAEQNKPDQEIYKELYEDIKKVEINLANAYKEIEETCKHSTPTKKMNDIETIKWREELINQHKLTAQAIEEKQFFFRVNETNERIDTNITNIKKAFRKHLTINGEKLIEIDVSNSQSNHDAINFMKMKLKDFNNNQSNPSFSPIHSHPNVVPSGKSTLIPSSLLHPNVVPSGRASIIPFNILSLSSLPHSSQCGTLSYEEDVYGVDGVDYIKKCTSGTLFKFLMEEFNKVSPDKQLTLKETKTSFFTYVIYSDDKSVYFEQSLMKQVFEDRFPTVWAYMMKQKKQHGYRGYCVKTQKEESDFMIHKVCKSLKSYHKGIPLITIHDAILTTAENVNKVVKVIQEQFSSLGLKEVQVKIEGVPYDKATGWRPHKPGDVKAAVA